MAHQTPKPVIANCVPKLVAMSTSLCTYGPPSNTISTPIDYACRPYNSSALQCWLWLETS